jgi:hypothetical protein
MDLDFLKENTMPWVMHIPSIGQFSYSSALLIPFLLGFDVHNPKFEDVILPDFSDYRNASTK